MLLDADVAPSVTAHPGTDYGVVMKALPGFCDSRRVTRHRDPAAAARPTPGPPDPVEAEVR